MRKFNRIRKTEKKRYQGWCDNCDRAIVEKRKKCPSCGVKDRQ